MATTSSSAVEHYDAIIIGAGITGLTTAFYLIKEGFKVAIVEREKTVGGQMRSFSENGFLFEAGPNTGVLSNKEVVDLFNDLGGCCSLEIARKESKQRLIFKCNRFHPLPSGLWSGITTPLFSIKDKLGILVEPLRPKGTDPNESIAAMVCRRLGQSFLDYAVDPFISGIYAGNPQHLITRHALPKLHTLEQQYGSFIRGSIKSAKARKTALKAGVTKDVFSVSGGFQQLPIALEHAIEGKATIIKDAHEVHITPVKQDQGWEVCYNQTQHIYGQNIITTTGAYELEALLPFLPQQQITPITQLRYAQVIQVSVGFENLSEKPNAFGGLIPSIEKRDVLGILFPSACFEGRAPQDGALFSIFIGGIQHPELTELDDESIVSLVQKELKEMMGIDEEPTLIKIFRHKHAIAQYEADSQNRYQAIESIEKHYPGLWLRGNIQNGIGISDRIKQGHDTALKIIKQHVKS